MIVKSLATQDTTPIAMGRDYQVYGLAQYALRPIVLICSDDGRPNWCPLEWFRVVDGRVPGWWKFSVIEPTGAALQLLFGYPELVNDPEHYDELIQREPKAISIFQRIADPASRFSTSSDEEFLSNFGVVPTGVDEYGRFSLELSTSAHIAIRLRWDTGRCTGGWSLLVGEEVVAEEILDDLVELSIYCDDQESGLILRSSGPPELAPIRIQIYPNIRVHLPPR